LKQDCWTWRVYPKAMVTSGQVKMLKHGWQITNEQSETYNRWLLSFKSVIFKKTVFKQIFFFNWLENFNFNKTFKHKFILIYETTGWKWRKSQSTFPPSVKRQHFWIERNFFFRKWNQRNRESSSGPTLPTGHFHSRTT